MSPRRPRFHRGPNPSRRDLLAATAAVAGVSLFPSACASVGTPLAAWKSERRRPPQPGETIRIGVVGIGAPSTPAMGFGHCDRICTLAKEGRENVQIVAISDVAKPYLERGVAHCSELQGIAVDGYRDYRELFAREDLHGVLLAVPEHWHAKMACDAVAAGLDVYLEKPMALDLDDALRLRECVLANEGVVFQVGTQYLQLAKYHAAKKLIAEGAIGQPTLVQTSYCRNSKDGEWLYEVDPAVVPGEMLDWEAWCGPLGAAEFDPQVFYRWRRYRKYSTGIVGDLLVHMMTPLVYALDPGWPVHVSASGGHYVDREMENHDQVHLTIRFEKPVTMVVAGSTCNENGFETLIRGHEGNLYLGGNDCVLRPERVFAEEKDEATVPCPGIADQDEHRLNWLACMRTREPAIGDVTTAAKVMVIVDLATRSLWGDSAQTFDPSTMTARLA